MPLDGHNYQGRNFAPVDPLRDAKRTAKRGNLNPSSSNAFFREKWQECYRQDDDVFREYIEQARTIALLRSGKLIMKRDLTGSGFVFFTPTASSTVDRTNYPIFAQNCETLKAKWERSKPVLNARYPGDGYKTTLQMKLVNTAIQSYFRDIFTPAYELAEANSAQDWGTYITHFYYDDKLNQMSSVAPVLQGEPRVVMAGYAGCFDCLYEATPKEFALTGAPMPQCPKCESFRTTNMVPEQMATDQAVVGVEKITQGDLTGRLRSCAASRWDLRRLPHESPYYLYSERIPLNLIRSMFGDEIEVDADGMNDIGLELIESLATRGGITENNGQDDFYGGHYAFFEEATLRNMYLKPEALAGFKLDKPEKTFSGTIPADVDWAELFPEGLLVRGFNDMQLIIGYHAEAANIASSVFCLESESGKGKGLEDGVDIAKDLNEVASMAMAGLKRYGAGGVVADKNSGLTEEDVRNLFKPRKVVFADLSQTGGDVNKAVMQMRVNPVNPVLPQYMIQLSNTLALTCMNGDFAQGATNDVDIDTLGGQELATAKEEGKKSGILAMKTWHRIQSAEILSRLMKKHTIIPRWYSHGDDRHATTRGKWVSGAELPDDPIKFDAVGDSEIPQNPFERKQAARQMFQDAGGLPGLIQAMQIDPKTTAVFARLYNVELPTLDEDELQTVCLSRLDDIKKLSQMLQTPEEIIVSLTKPVKTKERNHILKAEFLSQILDDDELISWNPVAQDALDMLIDVHYLAEAGGQVEAGLLMTGAQGIVAGAQAGIQNSIAQPMMDQQRAMAQEDAGQNAAMDMMGRALDEETKNADYERSEAAAASAHERSKDLEREKARLAPKPAAAPKRKK